MTETTTPLEAATKMLEDLDHALLRLQAKGVELGDERSSIALSAHTGDEKAKKRLGALNREIATHGAEVDSLLIAVKAAEDAVERGKQEEKYAAAAVDARALRDQYKRFVRLADVADEHLRSFVAAAGELKRTVDAIHCLNSGSAPTSQQLLVFGEMAVRAAVMETMWSRSVEFLAPNQRHTFPKLARGWAEPAIKAIDQLLGDEKQKVA